MPAELGWITLPRNYLEEQFDRLGLERHFETGITDPDSVNRTERLSDLYDDRDDRLPVPRGPRNPNRVPFACLLKTPDSCKGSNAPANGDRIYGKGLLVVCSVCNLVVPTYPRRRPDGMFKAAHLPRSTVSGSPVTVTKLPDD